MHIHLEHSVREHESSEGAVTLAGGLAVTHVQLCADSHWGSLPRSSYVQRRAAVASAANVAAKAAADAAARVDETEEMKTGLQLRLDVLPVGVEIRRGEWTYIVTESSVQAKISSSACSLCSLNLHCRLQTILSSQDRLKLLAQLVIM